MKLEIKMSLRKPNAAASNNTPAFENMDDTASASADAAVSAPAATPAPAPTAVALANPNTGALALAGSAGNFIGSLKNALRVDYNTLAQITAAQGEFADRESGVSLGKSLDLELLSWQDSYVCSPNDDDADKELVKYSDDGVTAKDGSDLFAHLAELKLQGYAKAKISHRAVVVGAVTACAGNADFEGQLVQLDLAPTSKTMFDRHMATVSFKASRGMIDPANAAKVRLTAEVAKGQGTIKYTVVKFASA